MNKEFYLQTDSQALIFKLQVENKQSYTERLFPLKNAA